jgi:heat shock protein HslJ
MVVFCIATFSLAGGCNREVTTMAPTSLPAATTPTSITPSLTPSSDQPVLRFRKMIWNSEAIYLFGYASVPDRTKLYVQLSQNGQPAEWHKNYLNAFVLDGRWEVSLKAMSWTAPEKIPNFEAGYSFHIWDLLKPEIDAAFSLPFPMPAVTPITSLNNTQWKLVSLNGSKLIANTTIDAYFDIKNKGAVLGNATINSYGGKYETDAPDNLIIYDLMWTQLGGSDDKVQQETDYVRYLHDAATIRLINNQLEIYDQFQNKRLVFEKIP